MVEPRSGFRLFVSTVAAVVVGAMSLAWASASDPPTRISAPVDEGVQAALGELAQPSSPAPRAGDVLVGHDTYRSTDPCSVVQQHYGGTLSVFDTGWSTVFVGAYGEEIGRAHV